MQATRPGAHPAAIPRPAPAVAATQPRTCRPLRQQPPEAVEFSAPVQTSDRFSSSQAKRRAYRQTHRFIITQHRLVGLCQVGQASAIARALARAANPCASCSIPQAHAQTWSSVLSDSASTFAGFKITVCLVQLRCFLLSAFCFLLFAVCVLRFAFCVLRFAFCVLYPVASAWSWQPRSTEAASPVHSFLLTKQIPPWLLSPLFRSTGVLRHPWRPAWCWAWQFLLPKRRQRRSPCGLQHHLRRCKAPRHLCHPRLARPHSGPAWQRFWC